MAKIIGNQNQLPEILYKYRDWNNKNHRRIISNNELYLATPGSFNDPFDCKIPMRWDKMTKDDKNKMIDPLLETITRNRKLPSERLIEVRDEIFKSFFKDELKAQGWIPFDKLDQKSGLICLTSDPLNILMWSHYASSHHGFCIGFYTEALLKLNTIDYIGMVNYSASFPVTNFDASFDIKFYNQMFSKSDLWAYEKEYRISKMHMSDRLIQLPDEAIAEIYLGCQISEQFKNEIIQTVNIRNIPIKIFETKAHVENYEIVTEIIN